MGAKADLTRASLPLKRFPSPKQLKSNDLLLVCTSVCCNLAGCSRISKRSPSPVKFSPSAARKLALDEDSFQQLLEAAYALQENKDVLRAGSSENDSASVFSEIAALRSQILAHPHVAKPHVV